MLKITIKPNNLVLMLILFLSILPSVYVLSFGMPVLYLLLPIGVLIFFFVLLGEIGVPKITKSIILLFILILIEIFISTLYGTITTIDKFEFPTDSFQYIARYLALISFIIWFYKGNIKADTFIKYFLVFLNIAMLIGILQWIPWPGREFFIQLYPFRDGSLQLNQLNRDLSGIRMHGFSQHGTANGGIATFFFVFAYSVFKYYKKYKGLSVILMVLAIVTIFASQARAGMLALVFSILLFYIINIYIFKKSLKPTLYMFFGTTFLFGVVTYLYKSGNNFIVPMVSKWNQLFETEGGGRTEQALYFFSEIETPFQFLFGLSKQVINNSVYSYGVEIEPVNIFIQYGAVGFLLQYSVIVILLIYFLKGMKYLYYNKTIMTLMAASFVGLFSYQVFSIGYYFFRELRVGLFPWILMGVAIAVYERYKNNGGNYEQEN
ncbi:hypothetical protein ACFSKI_10545 [Pseudogracilibacillus auburnensis]|uniref:O-antigen ligase-like membrane protein n=1 Tax=Pseudogracilibacillus auburnensis TaxID=1494959 RepID=A0A2V3VVH8_9BACI|nr:hypothetical protein [Pseudogracilibacillus auburnensis]PXW85957.1 hypothetical protein DFR56_109120 [Pseudogracilibacillus auburnensis]